MLLIAVLGDHLSRRDDELGGVFEATSYNPARIVLNISEVLLRLQKYLLDIHLLDLVLLGLILLCQAIELLHVALYHMI